MSSDVLHGTYIVVYTDEKHNVTLRLTVSWTAAIEVDTIRDTKIRIDDTNYEATSTLHVGSPTVMPIQGEVHLG